MSRSRRRDETETVDFLDMVARLVRRAGVRVADADEIELAKLLELERTLAAAIAAAVEGQRARGLSWADVARATGKTRQAAFQRWGSRDVG